MNSLKHAIFQLQEAAAQEKMNPERFFKTDVNAYAAHDRFLGVSVPTVHAVAKQFAELSHTDLQVLIQSKFNEERLLALFILTSQYQKGSHPTKELCYKFYITHIDHVNNWNLIDASCRDIVGAHLEHNDRSVLHRLAASDNLWKRRIAIVSTWHFIRNNDFEWTVMIAKTLIADSHDLIHKAVGWMLREMGGKNNTELVTFLDEHAHIMPRTMLRYAIEKFPADIRKNYLARKKNR